MDTGLWIGFAGLCLSIIGGFATIFGMQRKVRREAEADAQGRTDRIMAAVAAGNATTDSRLKELEVSCRDFMPRREIEGKLEHEKANRQMALEGINQRLTTATGDIVDIKVHLGRLEQKHDGMTADMGEIKSLIKDQAREGAARFDRLQASIDQPRRR